jgi:hypothetical protein
VTTARPPGIACRRLAHRDQGAVRRDGAEVDLSKTGLGLPWEPAKKVGRVLSG